MKNIVTECCLIAAIVLTGTCQPGYAFADEEGFAGRVKEDNGGSDLRSNQEFDDADEDGSEPLADEDDRNADVEGGAEEDGLEPLEDSSTKITFGADGALVVPFGNWADAAGIGYGGLVALGVFATPNVALTARIGYIKHQYTKPLVSRDGPDEPYWSFKSTTSEIPVLVGLKIYSEDYQGFYVSGEFGIVNYSMATTDTCDDGRQYKDSQSVVRAGATVGLGYEISVLHIGASVFFPNIRIPKSDEESEDGGYEYEYSTYAYNPEDEELDDQVSIGLMLNFGLRF